MIFKKNFQFKPSWGFRPGLAFSFFEPQTQSFSLGTDWLLIAPSDPERVYISFQRSEFLAIADIYITFGQAGASAPFFALPTNFWIEHYWSKSGPLCGYDWYAKSNGGAVNLNVTTVRYATTNG